MHRGQSWTIVDNGGDYVLSVKANQRGLHEDIKDLFDGAEHMGFSDVPYDHRVTINKGHGRIETRQCWTVSDSECLNYIRDRARWEGLNSVVKVTAQRLVGDKTSVESRYYISSLAGDAQRLLHATRTHWNVENCLHWVLDIAFREDESRIRKGHGPHNFGILRHIALHLLKKETTSKGGTKAKRLRAGWSEDYLLKVLNA